MATTATTTTTTAAALLDARPVKPGTRRAVLELRRLRRAYLRDLQPHLKALRAAARACTRLKRAMRARAAALLERGTDRPRSLDVDRHGTLDEQRRAGGDRPPRAGLEDIAESAERFCHIAARARDSAAGGGVAPRLPDEPDADALATDDDEELTDAEGAAAVAAEYAGAPGVRFDSSEDEDDEDDADWGGAGAAWGAPAAKV
jgi:hypothetical protein